MSTNGYICLKLDVLIDSERGNILSDQFDILSDQLNCKKNRERFMRQNNCLAYCHDDVMQCKRNYMS